jgi:hypothetical protein
MAVVMAGLFREKRGIRRAMPSSLTKRIAPAAVAALVAFACGGALAQTTPKPADNKKDDKKDDKKKVPETKPAETTKPAVESDKEKHKEKENPRAVYLALDLGLLRSDVGGFTDRTALDRTGANGESYGIGGGVRFGALRLGARFRGMTTTEFELWSVQAQAGVGLPLRPLEPVLFAHAGYLWSQGFERSTVASSLPSGNILPPTVDVRGVIAGVEAFGGYWINDVVRLGPFAGFDMLFVSREKAPLPQTVLPGALPDEIRAKPLYNDSGSGLGYNINLGVRGVLDLGF